MNQQLSLDLPGNPSASAPVLPARLAFPNATDGGPAFDDEERFFEPWWPGAQAFLRLQAGRLEVRTEHLSDPLLAFPELRDSGDHIAADGVIIEGTLLALDIDGRPDPRLLRQRLAGASSELAEGAFVAADLIYLEGRSLAAQPFVERRRQLASIVTDSDHAVVGPGLAREGTTLAVAVAALGLDAISARRLDARWRAGPAGDAWLKLSVMETPVQPTKPFLVLLEKLPLQHE